MITPLGYLATEYVWDVSDARHLGGGADFVWDSSFIPDVGSFYRAELRIGVPETPENVRLSGVWVLWDPPSAGPGVESYRFWIISTRTDGSQSSYYNVQATVDAGGAEITYLADGPEFTIQVRALNSNGYSPWTEIQTFTTPTSS